MDKSKITIHHIAKEAGVSISTVSRVLNKNGYISQEARYKVLKAMEVLGYQIPNSGLSNDKIIIVIFPSYDTGFSSPTFDGIQATAFKSGYNIIGVPTQALLNKEDIFPPYLSQTQISGIIIGHFPRYLRMFNKKINADIKVVQCNEIDESLPYPYVSIDNCKAVYDAINYLYTTGRRKIAFLNLDYNAFFSRKRGEGFMVVLRDLGLETNSRWIVNLNIENDFSKTFFTQGFNATKELLSLENRPDAIFAVSDLHAIGAIQAAKQMGFRIPEDISIMGFDDSDFSVMIDPPLTTIKVPYYEIGCAACSMLIQSIQNNDNIPLKNILMDTELIVRGSTQPYPVIRQKENS
ncbi:MAG: LacI family transcriptional regulator [Treponema sp.]|nr:LacI family transcriptional regulator [Treponema sp.]